MKMIERDRYINGVYSVLYGFDWDAMEAIYRQVVNGVVKYVSVDIRAYFIYPKRIGP